MMTPDLSTVRLEVALFFRRSPLARETAESLARGLGYPEELVVAALGQLVEIKVLARSGSMYRYCRPYVAARWDDTMVNGVRAWRRTREAEETGAPG